MKCKRCAERAEVQLRAHNTAFCRPCYLFFFRRQVERAIAAQRMLVPGERIVVAVSGGKDSLALWDVLVDLGYDTTGLYLGLGIGQYSDASQEKVERFAAGRALPLRVVKLEAEGPGLGVPAVAAASRRAPCAACGTMKRHYFDAARNFLVRKNESIIPQSLFDFLQDFARCRACNRRCPYRTPRAGRWR